MTTVKAGSHMLPHQEAACKQARLAILTLYTPLVLEGDKELAEIHCDSTKIKTEKLYHAVDALKVIDVRDKQLYMVALDNIAGVSYGKNL